MFAKNKKGLIHTALTLALAVSVAQCAWAGFGQENKKLALNDNTLEYVESLDNKSDFESFLTPDDPNAVSVPSTTKLVGNIQIAGDADKVSVSLRDADVRQVLRMFADKTKMNIVFHNSAAGVVTLDLKDVPVNTALDFILDACGLTFVRQDNIMIIASKQSASDIGLAKQNFTTIPIKYVDATRVAKFLNKSVFNGTIQGVSSKPIAVVNASKNEIMLFGTDEDDKLVYKILDKLDVKPIVNNYTVNHVSPQEMASTICDAMLSDKSEGGSSSGVSISTESRGSNKEDVTLQGGFVACVVGEKGGSIEKVTIDGGKLENFASNPMTITFYPAQGTIATYGGSREQARLVEDFIKLHDKKQPMAYIELSLIQLSESGSKQFNTNWRVWTPLGGFDFGATGLTTNDFAQTFFKGNEWTLVDETGEPKVTYKRHRGWGPIVMSLNYLVSNGKGRVLASPKVMVANGKKSTIDLTSDYVKSIKNEYNDNSFFAISRQTYEMASDQGIKVELTPFISPDGYVVLNLKPEYSTIKDQRESYTLLTRRNLELENIRVMDGETLVLAGMIQEDERQSVVKLPVLGDLPLVGPFFRHTQNNTAKEELVILVTPHIVYSKDQIDKIKSAQSL